MTGKRVSRLSAGSLLAIPAAEDTLLIGEVLIPGVSFYLCVYARRVNAKDDITNINWDREDMLLIGETTDAELWRGTWKVCGAKTVRADFPKPFSVVNSPAGLVLRDFHRNVVRPASEKDFKDYGYEVSVSPVNFTVAAAKYQKSGLSEDFGPIDARRVMRRATLHSNTEASHD